MDYKDKLKIERLKAIFEDNFMITRLYANYLEHYPEVITKEMVEMLTESGITKEEALVAILSEIFGLDFENTDDRRLIMEYIMPSVRIMNGEKYTSNPYYQRVKIPNVTDGRWELRQESYKPYRGVIVDDMVISNNFREYAPLGFFTEEFHFPAVLEDGNEWMTLTPVDLDTCDTAIAEAFGKVVTFGLGLGYYAFMVSEKENVDSITIVEKSPDVIRLFEKYILPYFKTPDNVKIVNADAFEYAKEDMPKEDFNYAFVDTWRDAGDGTPMYEKMKKLESLSPNTKFSYWIENFLISRVRANRFSNILNKLDDGIDISYEDIEKELLSDVK